MSVEIIRDTKMYNRITTFKVKLPRALDRHIIKHRMFSINSQSSRAMSIDRVIDSITKDPVRFALGSNIGGMVAGHIAPDVESDINELIDNHQRNTVEFVRQLQKRNCSKEVANRYLEPFSNVKLIITATEWDNFFNLRCAPDAQREVAEVAEQMRDMLADSTPIEAFYHTPFLSMNDINGIDASDKLMELQSVFDRSIRICAARCARVSYDSQCNDLDYSLGERLMRDGHLTPFEHFATAQTGWHANFHGWKSGRKCLETYAKVMYKK